MADDVQLIISAIDNASATLQKVQGQLKQTESAAKSLGSGAGSAGGGLDKLGSSSKTASNGLSSLSGGLGSLAKAFGILSVVDAGARLLADTLSQFGQDVKNTYQSLNSVSVMTKTWGMSAQDTQTILDGLRKTSDSTGAAISDLAPSIGMIHNSFENLNAEGISGVVDSLGKLSIASRAAGISQTQFRMSQDNLIESFNKGDASLMKKTQLWIALGSKTQKALEQAFQTHDINAFNKAIDEYYNNMVNIDEIAQRDPWLALDLSWNKMVNSVSNSPQVIGFIQQLAKVINDFAGGDWLRGLAGITAPFWDSMIAEWNDEVNRLRGWFKSIPPIDMSILLNPIYNLAGGAYSAITWFVGRIVKSGEILLSFALYAAYSLIAGVRSAVEYAYGLLEKAGSITLQFVVDVVYTLANGVQSAVDWAKGIIGLKSATPPSSSPEGMNTLFNRGLDAISGSPLNAGDNDYLDNVLSGNGRVRLTRTANINLNIRHVSDDSISGVDVVRDLREYNGQIFTNRQLNRLAGDLKRFIS